MRIEFAQFTRFDQVELAAMAMEVTAGVAGNCLLGDLPIDEEQLLNEMLGNADEFAIETEVQYLREEEFSGRQLAREVFGNRVSEVLEDRKRTLVNGHPFDLEKGSEPSLSRNKIEDISPVYDATFALTLFLLLEDQEVVDISEQDRKEFKLKFGEIFELISAYALSATVEGIVWWTGHSRERKTFLQQLNMLVDIVDYGEVKSENQLEDNQRRVSDGGVDAIGVTTHEGVVQADAICYLLGATYQRDKRRDKIVGEPEITRLRAFFVKVPTVAFQGILSVPYSMTDTEAQDCRNENCLYFPRAVIERNLGIASKKEYEHGTSRYVETLIKEIREKLSFAINDFEILKIDVVHPARGLFH